MYLKLYRTKFRYPLCRPHGQQNNYPVTPANLSWTAPDNISSKDENSSNRYHSSTIPHERKVCTILTTKWASPVLLSSGILSLIKKMNTIHVCGSYSFVVKIITMDRSTINYINMGPLRLVETSTSINCLDRTKSEQCSNADNFLPPIAMEPVP